MCFVVVREGRPGAACGDEVMLLVKVEAECEVVALESASGGGAGAAPRGLGSSWAGMVQASQERRGSRS